MFRRATLAVLFAIWLGAVPTAEAQFSLAEQAATQSIGQGMQAGNAGAVTGAADSAAEPTAAPAADSVGIGGVKYIPAYAIVLMLIGLSGFVICRPSRRHAAD